MSDIEQKAIALLNEVRTERGYDNVPTSINRQIHINEALCRAIKQHEATKLELMATKQKLKITEQELSEFRQLVSDTMERFNKGWANHGTLRQQDLEALLSFIIPAAKPDPLVEVLMETELEFGPNWGWETQAKAILAALDARGLEIKEKGQ